MMGTWEQDRDFISPLPHLTLLECLQTIAPCPGSLTFQSRDCWETISRNLHFIKNLDLSSCPDSFSFVSDWCI